MAVIGLTGGIGSGKSAVSSYLTSVPRFVHADADFIAKEVFKCHEREILALDMNREWSDHTGVLRSRLFLAMLDSLDLKKQVEDLVLPGTRKMIEALVDVGRLFNHDVLLDVPLLFESGLDHLCDVIICVSCTRDEQIRRVKARSGYSDELIEKIIATQIDATEREARSDYVVSNNGTIQELHDSVNAIFKNVQLRIKI